MSTKYLRLANEYERKLKKEFPGSLCEFTMEEVIIGKTQHLSLYWRVGGTSVRKAISSGERSLARFDLLETRINCMHAEAVQWMRDRKIYKGVL